MCIKVFCTTFAEGCIPKRAFCTPKKVAPRGNSKLIRNHTEINIGAFERNSEYCCLDSFFTGKIYIHARPGDHVDKSKSTGPIKYRSMLGKDE